MYTITVSYNGRDLHVSQVASLEEAAQTLEILKSKYGDCIYTISQKTNQPA